MSLDLNKIPGAKPIQPGASPQGAPAAGQPQSNGPPAQPGGGNQSVNQILQALQQQGGGPPAQPAAPKPPVQPGGNKMQMPGQSKGLFNISPGMAAVLAIVSGAVQWAKYDLLSNSLAFIPAIFSGSTATMSPAIGFILALVVDLLQKMLWSGVNFRNGLDRKEMFYLTMIGLLVCAEVMGVAMPIVVPDINGLNMADLPQIFWSRFFYQLFGAGVFIALGGLGIIIGLTIMPEFLHEEAEKNVGTTAAWVLFGVGIVVARAIFSRYTGAPVFPQINWF